MESSKDTPRKRAVREIARRHACAIGASSVASQLGLTNSPSKIVVLSRQAIELRKWTAQAEVALLEILETMDNFERLETLFEMFDKDASGVVSISELYTALRKLDFHQSLCDSLNEALKDFESHSGMEIKEFATFINEFKESIGWSFEEVTEFLAIHVAFADGSVLMDEAVDTLLGTSAAMARMEDFNLAVMEVRLIFLFQLLDPEMTGYVDFEEVVKSLYSITKDMDETSRHVLLMCSDDRRDMNYDEFSQCIFDIIAAGDYDFHDIANGMTLSICKQEVSRNDLGQLFRRMSDAKSSRFNLSDLHSGGGTANNHHGSNSGQPKIDAVLQGKMYKLFDLWDLDHSGKLDLEEMMLGLGKYHQSKDLDITLDDTIKLIKSFDDDGDAKLDKEEFTYMMMLFSKKSKIPLHELIDFMVVTSALKDNDAGEKAYIASVKSRTRTLMNRRESIAKSKFSLRHLWK